jgi:hypothetical protein
MSGAWGACVFVTNDVLSCGRMSFVVQFTEQPNHEIPFEHLKR